MRKGSKDERLSFKNMLVLLEQVLSTHLSDPQELINVEFEAMSSRFGSFKGNFLGRMTWLPFTRRLEDT